MNVNCLSILYLIHTSIFPMQVYSHYVCLFLDLWGFWGLGLFVCLFFGGGICGLYCVNVNNSYTECQLNKLVEEKLKMTL